MDLLESLDADLEVALEVLMELLDFHRAVPLLLTAEVGYSLEVEVVDLNCHSVDHFGGPPPGGTPPPVGLLPATKCTAAWIVWITSS